MDCENVDSCSICMDSYDNIVRPRTLPCGHSFCGTCLTNSIKTRILICPHCQTPHKASSGNDFPISYGMEALITEMKKAKLDASVKLKSKGVCRPSNSRYKWHEIFEDQQDSLKDLIQISEEMKSELLHYKEFVNQRKIKHTNLSSQIAVLAKQNRAVIKQFEDEDGRLQGMLKEGEDHTKKATDTLSGFNEVTRIKDILSGSDEVVTCYEYLEGWRTECQKALPNAKAIISSNKVLKRLTAVFNDASTEEDEDSTTIRIHDLCDPSLSIMEKIIKMTERTPVPLAELKRKSESVKKLLEQELLYAVQNNHGKLRSAKVSINNNKIYLHYLKNEEPPVNAYTIEHNNLIEALNTDAVTTFLQLSWDGCNQGSVHIELSPFTPLATHFMALCTGQLGSSYAHSTFLEVNGKGREWEHVMGGDYEFNDGTGGNALIDGLNSNYDMYTQDGVPGTVYTRYDDDDGRRLAQFLILTGSGLEITWDGAFGSVTHGLEIVKKAAILDDISKVEIGDCGVLLPF